MTRRATSIWIVLLMTGCAGQKSDTVDLPESLPGGWSRGVTRQLPENAPTEIRALAIVRALEADYNGPQPLKVTIYIMSSATGGFEAAQKWRHREGAVAFHEGRYLVVIDAPQVARSEREAAADAISKSLR